ncbi:lactate dehydrogenase [Anaerosporomusa subterranea]|uniref:Lactate dehydrogenase n=1 Tax=Anaerosporomusa subterranea TaxID=1794912 RepID=A0A154BP55_ANASB|nr:Ldh family oxidoreductase [Anaerosporomusa subterranea]KYZ75665.1 lactate dehydrogenase [Anaerosporomusa subterranea]
MSEKSIVTLDRLEKFCSEVLIKAGLELSDAAILTESLLCAELRGVSSHGVVRLSTYLNRIAAGVMDINSKMTIEKEFPASALLNANNGFGQIAGAKAMDIAVSKAKTSGASVVAVKNSNHFGVAAYFGLRAVRENMVGLVITNSSPAMTPYNTKTPLLGTNPLAIAIPAGEQKPIVLDMSTSVVARGKIRYASLVGEKIPLGWAVDSDGRPTEDAKAALKGSLEPIGGPKGAGLSLCIDLLCGVLTGTALTGEVINVTDTSGPSKTGHLFIAINVASFINPQFFAQNVDKVITHIKSLPSASGGQVYMPGEIEFNLEAKRLKEGIPLANDVLADLGRLAERYEVSKLI